MFKRLILCDGCGVWIKDGKEIYGVKSEVLCPYCFWDMYSNHCDGFDDYNAEKILEGLRNNL